MPHLSHGFGACREEKNADPNEIILNDEQVKLGNIKTVAISNGSIEQTYPDWNTQF